jgi:hypothetical protein
VGRLPRSLEGVDVRQENQFDPCLAAKMDRPGAGLKSLEKSLERPKRKPRAGVNKGGT